MSAAAPAVLFVSLPAGRGGSVESLLTVLAGLDGRCQRIVARPAGTRVASHLADEQLTEETIDLVRSGTGAARLRSTLRLAREIRRRRRTLVAVHANGLSELMLCLPGALLGRRPVVVWVHDWQVSARQRRMARLGSRLASIHWLTVSEANRAALEADGVTGDAPVGVAPNPIDRPAGGGAPAPDPVGTTVAYLGAPAAYKGFDLLPAVIDRVAAHAPEIRWEIWSGPRHQEPEVFEALLERHARVTVRPKTDDVGAAYRAADIVFCPSRRESFGRVAAEALSHGRPLVASDLPALREVVGDAAVLVPPDDVPAAAAAIVALARDRNQQQELSRRGPARAAAWEPTRVVDQLAAAYGIDDQRPLALVVSHEATRTGAPAMAVEVARGLALDGWRVAVVLRADGPLRPQLADAAAGLVVEPLPRTRSLLRRVPRLRALANRADERIARRMLDRVRPDLVWANTVLAAGYVRPARERRIPVVLHVHELSRFVPRVLGRYDLLPSRVADPSGPTTDPTAVTGITWVAASGEAAAELAGAGLAGATILESAVDVAAVQRRATYADATRPGTSEPRRTALVGACGRADERKGVDLWLDVAARVHTRRSASRFVWIGDPRPEDRSTVDRERLTAFVHFTGELPDPAPTLAQLDVFTLPSRLDTFPLVVLEAMALGRPVVAFDTGGVRRQLGDAGLLVPPGDLAAFAAAVERLLDEPEQARALGEAARARVTARFDIAAFHRGVGAIAAAAARTA